jgi:hypothetical protein
MRENNLLSFVETLRHEPFIPSPKEDGSRLPIRRVLPMSLQPQSLPAIPAETARVARAAEIGYPIEAVVETAIASFLDAEALGFVDCKPGRGQ